jgi:hypothetical protein
MKLITALLIILSFNCYAQDQPVVGLNVTFGTMARSLQPISGSYEGIEVGYRIPVKPRLYWEITGWNTDLEHLIVNHDTATRQAFGLEFGIAGGIGFKMVKTENFSFTIVPQLGGVFDTQNTDRSHYASNIIVSHFNPVARLLFRLDYKMFEISAGNSYQCNPAVNSRAYFNRVWFGIGMTQ